MFGLVRRSRFEKLADKYAELVIEMRELELEIGSLRRQLELERNRPKK